MYYTLNSASQVNDNMNELNLCLGATCPTILNNRKSQAKFEFVRNTVNNNSFFKSIFSSLNNHLLVFIKVTLSA